MFSVYLDGFSSSSSILQFGVPQGSIWAPVLFSLYMLPLGSILTKHGVSFHFYADDTQIYLPLRKNDQRGLGSLNMCLADIKSWFSSNILHLNEGKTEAIVFGSSGAPDCDLGDLDSCKKLSVRNLAVNFDSALKCDKQINSVVRSSFFQLRLLSKAKSFLSFKSSQVAFIYIALLTIQIVSKHLKS